jgi:predicted acetyltransferase
VVEEDGGERGYVAFVRATKRSESVIVAELVATDDEYARQLLDFLRELAGGSSIRLRAQPVDVVALLDSRATDRQASSQLWLRIVDVALALSRRSYSAASSTVLAVSDELLETNRGVFRLETYDDGAVSVAFCNDEPAITLDVGSLGRVFLGGSTFSELAASGEIVVSDVSVLAGIDRAFATTGAPFCSTLL